MTTLQKQYVLTKTEHIPLIEVEENRQQCSSPNNAEERKNLMFLDEKANEIKMDGKCYNKACDELNTVQFSFTFVF